MFYSFDSDRVAQYLCDATAHNADGNDAASIHSIRLAMVEAGLTDTVAYWALTVAENNGGAVLAETSFEHAKRLRDDYAPVGS